MKCLRPFSILPSLRSSLGVLGAICIHLILFTQVIGTIYMTGNISAYLVSYLRMQGQSATLEDAVVILPIQIISSSLLAPIGAKLAGATSPRIAAVGNLTVVLATFCGSFCKSLWTFCLVYALGFGIGDGLAVLCKQYFGPLMMV